MKKQILFFLYIPIVCFSQTYRGEFEATEIGGNGNSFSTNFASPNAYILHNTENVYIESFLTMYKATKDKKWLDKFIIHCTRIQHHRDDQIAFFQSEVAFTTCSGIPYLPVSSFPTWSSIEDDNCNSYCASILHTASVSFTMSEFVHLVLIDEPDLQSNALPNEAIGYEPFPAQYFNLQTYYDFVVYLKSRIEQSIAFFNSYYWCDNLNLYKGKLDDDCNGSSSHANLYPNNNVINQQCGMGKLLAEMYIVEVGTSNIPLAIQYLEKTTRIASIVHSQLEINNQDASSYTWKYHMYQFDCIEDFQHAFLLMGFAHLCYQNNIPDFDHPLNKLFYSTDVQMLANTFAKHMYQAPLQFAQNTYGTCCICNPPSPPNPPYVAADDSYFYSFLSKYNPEIYQMVSDVFCERAIYGNSVYPAFAFLAEQENLFNPLAVKRNTGTHAYTGAAKGDFDGDGQVEFASLNTAQGGSSIDVHTINNTNVIASVNYAVSGGEQKYLASGDVMPSLAGDELVTMDVQNNNLQVLKKQGSTIAITSQLTLTTGNSTNVTGIAVGNFDAAHAGEEMLVAYENGYVYMYGCNSSNVLLPLTLTSNYTGIANVAGITEGDFNSDGLDDFAVVTNGSGDIRTFSIVNNALQQNASNAITNYPNPVYKGITSGDFDGDGTDELMVFQESCSNEGFSRFIVYRQNQNDIVYKNSEAFPTNQQNGIMCSMRLPNYQQSDALLTFRNYDGQIAVFNMDGLCQGLTINTPIDGTTSIDNAFQSINNNYPIDYHVNNTLVASNAISSPAIVDMSSGKEIIFKPGFTASAGSDLHAYIAPALACNPETFRKPTTHPPVKSTANPYRPIKDKEELPETTALKITPNPSIGTFQLAVTKNEKPTGVQEIKVYDIMGKTIWQTGASANTIYDVDISQYAKGIYYVKVINTTGEIQVKKLVKE